MYVCMYVTCELTCTPIYLHTCTHTYIMNSHAHLPTYIHTCTYKSQVAKLPPPPARENFIKKNVKKNDMNADLRSEHARAVAAEKCVCNCMCVFIRVCVFLRDVHGGLRSELARAVAAEKYVCTCMCVFICVCVFLRDVHGGLRNERAPAVAAERYACIYMHVCTCFYV
jgi:hypothetical protein